MAEDEDPVVAPRRRQSETVPLPQGQSAMSISASPPGDPTRPSSRLHNFSFPSVNWGTQRLLRCAKVDPTCGLPTSGHESMSAAVDDPRKRRRIEVSPSPGGTQRGPDRDEEPVEPQEGSIVAEFQRTTTLDRIPPPSSSGSPPLGYEESRDGKPAPSPPAMEAPKPWNLRMRRAACNVPAAELENGSHKVRRTNQNPTPQEENWRAMKYGDQIMRLGEAPGRTERPKFWSTLSKDEIGEDFLAMTGSKPHRRPKKRPRNVQNQIETLFPGFLLCEVTPDLYKIPGGK